MIRSIIFDLDGTLLDRDSSLYEFIVAQYDSTNKLRNINDLDNYIHRFIELDSRGYVWKDIVYQQLIKEFDLALDWTELLNEYINDFCKYATPFPNTYKALEKLKGQGYKLGIITNGFEKFQFSNIKALGIQHYFDVILISEREGLRKPDPAIFHRAAHLMNVLPEECVYVGDHPTNDVTASRNAGMKAIWKEDTFYKEQFEYDGVIRDLLEIECLIEQWNTKLTWMKE